MSKIISKIGISISIHTLRMEGDYYNYLCDVLDNISIHTLRMEGDGHYF